MRKDAYTELEDGLIKEFYPDINLLLQKPFYLKNQQKFNTKLAKLNMANYFFLIIFFYSNGTLFR